MALLILAVIFLVLAILTFVAYGGTPHGGPTTTCAPIHFFGHDFTIKTDCRYVSAAEIALAIALLLLSVITTLMARPRR